MESTSKTTRAQTPLIITALLCLLLSDGVGPRLLPYPALLARAFALHAGTPLPDVASHVNLQRERALVALGVKFSHAKALADRSGFDADGAGVSSRRAATPFVLTNRRSSEARALTSLYHLASPALLRGPPRCTS